MPSSSTNPKSTSASSGEYVALIVTISPDSNGKLVFARSSFPACTVTVNFPVANVVASEAFIFNGTRQSKTL